MRDDDKPAGAGASSPGAIPVVDATGSDGITVHARVRGHHVAGGVVFDPRSYRVDAVHPGRCDSVHADHREEHGARSSTGATSDAFRDGWDRIFGGGARGAGSN